MSDDDPLHLMAPHEPGTVDPVPVRITVAERNGMVVPYVELSAHLQRCSVCRARYGMFALRALANVCDQIEEAEGRVVTRSTGKGILEPISDVPPNADDIFATLGDIKIN